MGYNTKRIAKKTQPEAAVVEAPEETLQEETESEDLVEFEDEDDPTEDEEEED